jgi:hypothetical protein
MWLRCFRQLNGCPKQRNGFEPMRSRLHNRDQDLITPSEPEDNPELIAKTNILGTLSRMGMAQTNLVTLAE